MASLARCAPLSVGYRPMFLLAAVAAIVTVGRTALALQGVAVPAGNPFVWHGHEMLFGYVAAVIAGFLLTAVPNWTGSATPAGAPLALLAALWLAARAGLWSGDPAAWAVAADLAFLPAAALIAARPMLRGGRARHWLPVGVVLLIAALNGAWHLAAALGQPALMSRMLAATTMLIALLVAVIGGRITPAFTRNALHRRGVAALPRGADLRDTLAIGLSAAVVIAELVLPAATAALALAAAALHAARLYGWRGLQTLRDPLLLALHVGYGWLAAGYAIRAMALLGPQWSGAWALHGLLVGAIGTMTLAMMARVSLGHSGRPLRAGIVLTLAFCLVQGAAVVRLLDFWLGPDAWRVAGTLWTAAFAVFLVRCAPMLLRPRVDAARGPA